MLTHYSLCTVWCSLIGCLWILIRPRTSCLIVISSAHLNERKHSGPFHIVIATSLGSAVWMNFLVFASARGGRENGVDRQPHFVSRCVFVSAGGRGWLFLVAVSQVRQGFPRCYFLLTLGFVLVSHHMLWLVLSFEGVGPQHNSIPPTKHARATSHSKLEVFASPSGSPCRYIFIPIPFCLCQVASSTHTRRADGELKEDTAFLSLCLSDCLPKLIYKHWCVYYIRGGITACVLSNIKAAKKSIRSHWL